MISYSTSQFKIGLKLIFVGNPCTIICNEFVKPGKGHAFNRVKFKDLITGKILDKTFKSGESLKQADILEMEVQYLYNDGALWHFMHLKSFEQYEVERSVLADFERYLIEQNIYSLTLWDNKPISVIPPKNIVLEVVSTDPGIKGDTVGASNKSAVMKGGAVVRVPLFINVGDKVKVDTRVNEYLNRA